MISWNDGAPIYRQLADRLTDRLLAGDPPDGAPMPSVRALASEYVLNPLTVGRALQLLVEGDVLEPRRGLGMYVRPGAGTRLRDAARRRFLEQDWPALVVRLRRLGLTPADLSWND